VYAVFSRKRRQQKKKGIEGGGASEANKTMGKGEKSCDCFWREKEKKTRKPKEEGQENADVGKRKIAGVECWGGKKVGVNRLDLDLLN